MFSWKSWAKRIPSQVKFGKSVYPIYWSDKIEDGSLMGVTYYDPKQIIIQSGMTDKQTVVTYGHELLHLISFEFEIGLTETQILKLEKAFYHLLKPWNIFKR